MKFDGRVLVCGSRDFGTKADAQGKRVLDPESPEYQIEFAFLEGLFYRWVVDNTTDPLVVIEGEAMGADSIAREWVEYEKAESMFTEQLDIEKYPADWTKHGKAGGPIRNKQMLVEGKPSLVVAFSNDFAASRGTVNMVTQATKAGVPVVKIEVPRIVTSEDDPRLFEGH